VSSVTLLGNGFQQFLHCCARTLLSHGSYIVASLHSRCLVIVVFVVPYSSCQASCHNIMFLIKEHLSHIFSETTRTGGCNVRRHLHGRSKIVVRIHQAEQLKLQSPTNKLQISPAPLLSPPPPKLRGKLKTTFLTNDVP
jgi:hypothetical protein